MSLDSPPATFTMSKLCFSSIVFGAYQKYIPYYVYSISKTYPESYAKVFVETSLDSATKSAIDWLQRNHVKNFEIVEMRSDFGEFAKYKMRGSGAKSMVRWLLGEEYFKSFDYAYIGDIDIMILPEKESIIEVHERQMAEFGLPFSNKVRVDAKGRSSGRLSGLHFIKVREYFRCVEPIIDRIWKDLAFRDAFMVGLERNESFLYKLAKEAFPEFSEQALMRARRPWHGIHLGITRGNVNIDLKTIEQNSSLTLSEIRDRLVAYASDPVFQGIQKLVFVRELQVILKLLSVDYPWRWSIQGLLFRVNSEYLKYRRRFVKFFSR